MFPGRGTVFQVKLEKNDQTQNRGEKAPDRKTADAVKAVRDNKGNKQAECKKLHHTVT